MNKPSEEQRRREKLAAIVELGHDPYPHQYEVRNPVEELVAAYSDWSLEQLDEENLEVQTAGRIMSRRRHGKVGFIDVAGGGQKLQVYVRRDAVGEENYELFKQLDVGDWIGVVGKLSRTRTGELTIFATRLDFLAKALLPLPEKWHGLTDIERRYRQRYVDLIANPEVREIFLKRSALIRATRRFLDERGFVEVETPMMQPIAGGATARPFQTFHEALGIPLYLRIAPELYLKRLTVGGLERVYEINRNFRNEGISTQHNPEFTMLEFYAAFLDYRDLMDLTEELMREVVEEVRGRLQLEYGDQVLDFGSYRRLSMLQAIQEFWDGSERPSADQLTDRAWLGQELESRGISFQPDQGWGKLMGELFEDVAEAKLQQPTFIYDLPVELSPLSKRKDEDPRFVERFELFIGGMEIANAYSELNDPDEQRKRFEEQLLAREAGDAEAHVMDEDYIRALQHGMPPTGGEGIGMDRLAMLITGCTSIRDVILFPQLRPETGRAREEEESNGES